MEKPTHRSFLTVEDLSYVLSALSCPLEDLQARANVMKTLPDPMMNLIGEMLSRFVEKNRESWRAV